MSGHRVSALGVLLWLVATCLVALSPLVYFASGASDGAGEAARVGLAAVPALIAWPLLALAIGIARASLAMAFAAVLLWLARRLGAAPTIEGDTAWALYWVAAGAAWTALGAVLLRRP